MVKNILLTFAMIVSISMIAMAQENEEKMAEDEKTEELEGVFRPKPKNMWEIGLQVGHSFLGADVDPVVFGGFGVGGHLRKAINYTFSIRGDLNYITASGLDARPTVASVVNSDWGSKSELPTITGYYYRNHKTTMIEASLLGVLNLGNILFHAPENKWNAHLLGGLGLYHSKTEINALDGNNNVYDFSEIVNNFPTGTISERKAARDKVKSIFDDSRESIGPQESGVWSINDENDIHFNFQIGFGVSRKLSDRVNLSLEHKFILSDNDFLDGHRYRSTQDYSNNTDYVNYTALLINFNLGSKNKRVEPLYWVNPLLAPMSDIAEVKARPVLDLTDSDGDGVIDEWDKDNETPEGVAVDVNGIALDTDGDNVADFEDKEKLSPSGFDVDNDGVAMVTDPFMTEGDVKEILNNRLKNLRTNWFLPMIHFDLDKYYIKPEYNASLKHVAQVANDNPTLNFVVKGYTDVRAKDDYNQVLSYKRAQAAIDYLVNTYGVPRNRFILQYGGESAPLIPDLPESHNIDKEKEYLQFMNRRVEFSVAKSGDTEMSRPSGPDAGSGTPGSSRKGSKYSGNTNSGY